MKNFFGKSGMGTSILRGAQRLNPIDLADGQAARAWAYMGNPNPRNVGQNYDAARRVMRGTGPQWSGFDRFKTAVKGYFAGDNLSDMARNMGMQGLNQTPAAVRRRNALIRRSVAGGIGVFGASSLLMGSDSLPAVASGAGLKIGAHGTAAGLIGSRHPVAGAAYAAWTGLNMLRPGNNLGPF